MTGGGVSPLLLSEEMLVRSLARRARPASVSCVFLSRASKVPRSSSPQELCRGDSAGRTGEGVSLEGPHGGDRESRASRNSPLSDTGRLSCP